MSHKILFSREQSDLLYEAYSSGTSLRDLSSIFRISRPVIKEKIVEMGLEIRPAYIQRRRHSCDYEFFRKIDTETKAYWLGFIVADGSIGKETKNLAIGLAIRDLDHLFKFKEHLNATQPIWTSKKACRIAISGLEMMRDLSVYGVVPNKTFTAHVPSGIPSHLMRHFWRGMVDGDGSLYYTKKSRQWSLGLVGTYDLVSGFREEAKNICGTKANLYPHYTTPGIYYFCVGGNIMVKKLSNWLYEEAPVFLDRKYILHEMVQEIALKKRGKPLGGWPSEIRKRLNNYGKVL